MNNLLEIITFKERRRYNQIIKLINQKNYSALFEMDRDQNFGLSNQKYIDKILDKIEQEIFKNPEILIQMNHSNYHRNDYFNEVAIKFNPKIVERFIEEYKNIWNLNELNRLISIALDNGYNPSSDYINTHIKFFSNADIMIKLGDRIFDFITSDTISNSSFFGNEKAQQLIISKRPDLLLKMNRYSSTFEQFWIEAFKQGYIPEEVLTDYFITGNFLLFSKIVKQKPEMVKYCKIVDEMKREQIDELALCMGYVPTISDVQNSEYVKKSSKLMQALILRRPEAIKYIEPILLEGGYSLEIPFDKFYDLARLALDNGYVPTIKDLEFNPRLATSFDIMKILVQDNPELISKIKDQTPNKEELLKIAIANGFNGDITSSYSEIN